MLPSRLSDSTRADSAPSSTKRETQQIYSRAGRRQLCCTGEKLILFTFDLLFPPLWNLDKEKSCNTCIKNKCCWNGPTGSMQPRSFWAPAKRTWGERQSIRSIIHNVLSHNNNPHLERAPQAFSLLQRKQRRLLSASTSVGTVVVKSVKSTVCLCAPRCVSPCERKCVC